MKMVELAIFYSGVASTAFFGCGVFFFKLWRASKDRFFLYFGSACWILSLGNVISLFFHASLESLASPATESLVWVYLLRLCGYLAIVMAVIEKNRV